MCGPCRAIRAGLEAAAVRELPDPVPNVPGGAVESFGALPRRPARAEAVLALHMLADHFDYLARDAFEQGLRSPIYSAVDMWRRAETMTRDTAQEVAAGWWPDDAPDTRTAEGKPPADTSWILMQRLRARWPFRRRV
jgi:hypothetical protein